MLVDEDDLSTILDHAMTRKAEKGKDSLVGITFEQACQFCGHIVAIFHPRFYQGQLLIRIKSETVDDLVEIALVSEDARQVGVCLKKSIFVDFR